MSTYLGPTLWIAAGVVSLLLVIFLLQRLVRARLERRVFERFSDEQIIHKDLWANYFGRSQEGLSQIRGNGVLVLTDSALWFMLAIPRREIEIPLDTMTRVTTARSHLKKARLRPLLLVEFDTPQGPDSIAWALHEPEAWVETIETARMKACARAESAGKGRSTL